jgi:hypothetical protein
MSARFPLWMAASAALTLLTPGCGKENPEPAGSGTQTTSGTMDGKQAASGLQEAEIPAGMAAPARTGMELLPAAYTDTTAEFPHLRYRNGWESLNDRCPVRKGKLNLRLPPVYVNGHPVGFC